MEQINQNSKDYSPIEEPINSLDEGQYYFDQELLSIRDVAHKYLACSPTTVYRLVRDNKIPVYQLTNKGFRILLSDIRIYIYKKYLHDNEQGSDIRLGEKGEELVDEKLGFNRFSGKNQQN